jgi:hypothetical protein
MLRPDHRAEVAVRCVRNCRSEEEPKMPCYFYVFEFVGVALGTVFNWRVLGLSSSHRLQGESHA